MVEDEIRSLLAAAGATGALVVHPLDEPGGSGARVELDPDIPVSAASVIKVVLALAFARAVCAGRLDPAQRTEVPAQLRIGGAGTAGFRDRVELSLRDLALSMMSVSDNAATDVIYGLLPAGEIPSLRAELTLTRTHVRSSMHQGHMSVVEELGLDPEVDLDLQLDAVPDERVRQLAWLDPVRANATTPNEMARLLEAIWTDRAGPREACALTRELMRHQVTSDRLAAGFEERGVEVASKTGTLPGVRNDAGVITYPDGRRYVAAVFTRTPSLALRRPRIDAAIGASARRAVDHLRTG